MKFTLTHRDGAARRGVLELAHGRVDTPAFMPVGTYGAVKAVGWDRPILTDSGGFQVFSLGALRQISEEGVQFASPINGDRLFLTPEESMRIQRVLDSDIVMVFDECTAYPATHDEAAASMTRSTAAANGSVASGMASAVWYARPALPRTSRAR